MIDYFLILGVLGNRTNKTVQTKAKPSDLAHKESTYCRTKDQ